jgi:hypothetical protein
MLYYKDLKDWAELATQRTCMQNLQQIKVQLNEHPSQTAKLLLDEVITSCSINCCQLQIATGN